MSDFPEQKHSFSQDMLPYSEALIEARQYLWSQQPPHGYVWVLRHGQRVLGGWYFWQKFEPVRYIKDPEARFGGGPAGFTVRDDRTIEIHGLLTIPMGVDPSTGGARREGAREFDPSP